MCIKINGLLLHLCCVLIFLIWATSNAFAGMYDCYIDPAAGGDYTMTMSSNRLNIPLTGVDSPTEISTVVIPDVPIILRGDIGCKVLSGGDESVHLTNTSDAAIQTSAVTNEGSALFATSIEGIVYSMELFCSGCIDSTVLRVLSPYGAGSFIPNSNIRFEWEDTDSNWRLRFRLYQTASFRPQNGVTNGHAIPGQIATWQIGSGEHSAKVNFRVDVNSLDFTVSPPTCLTTALVGENTKGNQVLLGDYYVYDIHQGVTPEVPFIIRGENCGASRIDIKLRATTASPNTELVGKSAGTAEGVGIRVVSTANNNNLPLKPDASNAATFTYSEWWNPQLDFPFTAQLIADGQTVRPGSFTGNATFNFSYE